VKLEEVGRPAEHFAPRLVVPDGAEQPGGVPLDAEDAVVHPAVPERDRGGFEALGGRPATGRDAHQGGALPWQVDDLAPVVGGRVEQHRQVAVAGEDNLCPLDQAARPLQDGGVVGGGVLVDPMDARAGKDVVELVDQEQLPERLGLPGDVEPGGHRPHLRLAERLLGAPVGQLDVGVGRVSPPVVLEVQLPHPGLQPGRLAAQRVQEAAQAADLHAGQAVHVAEPAGPLHHAPRRPSPAVAVPVGVEGVARALGVLEVPLVGEKLGD
jgi:hypothetical protein